MRITNGMITNNTLRSLNTGLTSLNKLYSQMTTGKKIQTVSEDPIIAGKSLKLKINVLQNEQYQTNVKSAKSWMEGTETALENMTKVLNGIRDKCQTASSTGTNTVSELNVLCTQINQLWTQMQDEANSTYSGRYLFSGYKTSEPLMITSDTTLSQDVTLSSTEDYTVYSKSTLAAGSKIEAGTTLKAGTQLSNADATVLGIDTTLLDNGVLTQDVETTTTSDIGSEMTLASGSVLAKESTLAADSTITAGNINPNVYGKIDGQEMYYQVGTGSTIAVNTLKMDDTMQTLATCINDMLALINEAQQDDTTVTTDDLHECYNNAIGTIDELLKDISNKRTDLGSRVSRLEYVTDRLSDEETNLDTLLSSTEEVELDEAYVNFTQQYTTYLSALQATSKVISNTLADYL